MKKLFLALASLLSVASCSQITTNEDEKSALQAAADGFGETYVSCVVDYAVENASANTIDVSTAVMMGSRACEGDLDRFKTAQQDYLSTQVMMTSKPLQAAVDALDERATLEAGEALLAAGNTQSAAAVSGAAAATAAVATSESVTADALEQPGEAQQAYLDCMSAQARKYAGLDESAAVIADVAQDRCKPELAGPDEAALEQQGRATAMGIVLDAKLANP